MMTRKRLAMEDPYERISPYDTTRLRAKAEAKRIGKQVRVEVLERLLKDQQATIARQREMLAEARGVLEGAVQKIYRQAALLEAGRTVRVKVNSPAHFDYVIWLDKARAVLEHLEKEQI